MEIWGVSNESRKKKNEAVEIFLGFWKWYLMDGWVLDFIVVDILFYCNIYIILLC